MGGIYGHGYHVYVWLVRVVVRGYIDILTIINNFSYSTRISSFFGSSIPTSLFMFEMIYRSLRIRIRAQWRFFTSRGAHLNCAIMAMLYTHRRTGWWCLKRVIVYLARDILSFVMYYVNGKSRSSLLIQSTDSMIRHYRARS